MQSFSGFAAAFSVLRVPQKEIATASLPFAYSKAAKPRNDAPVIGSGRPMTFFHSLRIIR